MKLHKNSAEIFIPDGKPVEEGLKRTTCMAIVAHQDDIEIVTYQGVLQCFNKEDEWFSGVVVTNGAGSPRNGLYEKYTDEEMQKIRRLEQKKAAYVGDYGSAALLDYSSAEVKNSQNTDVVEDLMQLIQTARPKVIYTHNVADKHDTHVGVAARVIQAIRKLPADQRPQKLYGGEAWRSLDWVNDNEKVLFDVSAHSNVAAAVLGVFDSQISGGKRYDLATEGRRLSNATFSASHGTDTASAVSYCIDMTPLIEVDSLDIFDYINGYIERFSKDVKDRLAKLL